MKKILLVANHAKEHVRKFHIPFIMKMKELDWQVDVACRMDASIPECDYTFDLPCDRNPLRGGLIRSVFTLRQLIQENGYHIVHCHTVTGSLTARAACILLGKYRPLLFYTNHGLHFYKGAPASRWLFGYPLERILAPVTDVLITINDADLQMAKTHLTACGAIARTHGIGVDLTKFRNCALTASEHIGYRQKLGIAPDDFVMVYVAELSRNKNQRSLLDVLSIVRESIPGAKLLLIGPDRENGRLQNLAKRRGLSGYVRFLGWRDDIPQLLRISNVYTASSRSEGLGMNVIEAMACGIPVVAFRNRGHCEIISSGSNGLLTEQGDCAEMAEAVIRLHDSPRLRKQITKQAQRDIEKYDLECVLNELTSIYDCYQ